MVDILNFAGDESFEEVYTDRVSGKIGDIELFFPKVEYLISMKKSAGRLQDLADIESLERMGKDRR